ncbi:carbamoyl-phosphate synthase [Glutamicibacter sp. V16R2B1]|uniref:carboxylate--amine ligase n=1 Tax=Glutamicibacter sp. V16R2B1 TaxID=2036207 RepID=UPI0010FF4F26|nr:carbamoyl-phosphate synthase [Glutamicibacter sp. V16R2B1]TLK52656.1 carbamoyl-phosphate synthase [Glutamicibacter sp. V16R2B1]
MANPSTSIDPAQPFAPVILGGDIGTYTLAREFHEVYGVRSVVMPAAGNGVIEHSVAIELRPIGSMADEARVVQALRELAEELAGEGERPLLLFGSLDYHVMLIARHREELSAHYVIPYPELEVIEQAALKENFYALAERLGVPHPRTRVYRPGNAVATVVEGLNFPLIGKPSSSGDWIAAKFAGKQKIHTLMDFQQLTDLLSRIDASGYDSGYILQEYIPGGDDAMRLCTYFAAESDSGTEVVFAGYGEVVIEEHAPLVLGNSAAIVTGRHREVAEAGARMLREIGWHGVAMIDAKYDHRDGQVKFFEINPRLGRNHFYLTAAGINPARFYVNEFLGPQYDAFDVRRQPAVVLQDGMAQLREERLFTVLPHALLRRYLDTPTGRKAAALLKAGKVSNPLKYRAEKNPRRKLYLLLNAVNHVRKYRKFPPRTA